LTFVPEKAIAIELQGDEVWRFICAAAMMSDKSQQMKDGLDPFKHNLKPCHASR